MIPSAGFTLVAPDDLAGYTCKANEYAIATYAAGSEAGTLPAGAIVSMPPLINVYYGPNQQIQPTSGGTVGYWSGDRVIVTYNFVSGVVFRV